MASGQFALFILLAYLAVSFAEFEDNLNYKRWRLMVGASRDADLEKAVENSHRTRGRQYVRSRESLTKLIQQSFDDWDVYKTLHSKKYDSEDVETDRMLAFLSAQQTVRRHNDAFDRGNSSFKLSVNPIADLPFHEYRKLNGFRHIDLLRTRANFTDIESPFSEYRKLNGYRRIYGDSAKKNSTRFLAPMNVQVPDEIDWRDHGYVTDVKNQGMCGSCWAFSTTGSLEGQHKRATGQLVSLSEQNLVDCSERYGNHGCNGGLMDFAFQYIKENKGIDTEDSYPYLATQQRKCKFSRTSIGADDTGFVDLPEGDENQLKIAVATQGPISVAIDAGHRSFQLYKEGVYFEKDCSSEMLDHGVLVVGYGSDPVHGDYWIVKNSWGPTWGEKGYVRIARNKQNHCGIATKASYPLV